MVLQFDHVRGSKVRDISRLMQEHVLVAVLETEAAKCDVRCANCHVRRTAKQFRWRRWLDGHDLGAVDEMEESAAFQAAPLRVRAPSALLRSGETRSSSLAS